MNDQLVPVLTYHSVGDGPGGGIEPYRTATDMFREHVDALTDSGRTWVTISELGRRLRDDESVAGLGAVTFDDPYADAIDNALPVLAAASVPATVYSVSDGLGSVPPFGREGPVLATAEQLGDLGSGVEVGAHSVDHPEMDTLGARGAQRQIASSRAALEDLTGRPVTSFAYPHGYRSRQTMRLVRDEGLVAACGVGNALSHQRDDRFSIARILVTREHGSDDIARMCAGRGYPAARSRDRLATVGWRWARRIRRVIR